jgi:hypothetical protein
MNRYLYQWIRIETPEIEPHKYSQLIFDKGREAIQWNNDGLSLKSYLKLDIHGGLKKNHRHKPYTIDLNIKYSILKNFQKIRENL